VNKRRAPATAVGLALVLALSACSSTKDEPSAQSGSTTTKSAAATSVTIAVGGPFSGAEKPTGDQILAGAKLAADEVNADGGVKAGPLKGAKITLDNGFDDADEPAKAAANIRRVADDAKYLAFVGSGLSDASIAAAPDASRAGLPYLSAYASSPKILDAATQAKSVFVVPPTFPAYAISVTDELLKAGHTKPALLHLTGTYGDGVADSVVQHLAEKSITPVANESFTFGDTDLRTQLGKIKSKSPDSLVMIGLATSDALILKQADQLGLKVPAFDPGGITNSESFLKDAGPLANGVVGNTPSDGQRSTAPAAALRAAYTKATGESVVPDPAVFAYEGVKAVAAALADGAGNRKELVTKLHSVSIADTGVGPLSFASDGSRIGGRLYIFKIADGKPAFTTGYEQTGPKSVKEISLDR